MSNYFRTLIEGFGAGWNRFWFTPSDPSTLGVMRICVGALATYYYLTFAPDWLFFFGPDGILPADLVAAKIRNQGFTIFDWFSGAGNLLAVYWVGAVVLLMFTVGAFTRITSALALIWMISVNVRGPMLQTPVAYLFPMLLAYLAIGPSGAVLSIDAILRRRKPGGQASALRPVLSTSATIGQRLLQVHVTAVYAMLVLAQLRWPVWWNGQAAWELIARPDSRWLDFTGISSAPMLANLLTHAIVLFEFTFPLLIWNRLARPLMLGVAVVMWLLWAVLSGMIVFSLVMLSANLAFVSGPAMRAWFESRRRAAKVRA